jgi:hypothetical protein
MRADNTELHRTTHALRRGCAVAVTVAILLLGGGARAAAWGSKEYAAAGVPDLRRRWSTADLRTAVDALTRAVAGHPERLPRAHDPSSGPVFAKLLDPPPLDPAAAIDAQVLAHFERYRALVDAGALYGAIAQRAMPPEWVALQGIVLHEAAELERRSAPFLAALPPGDDREPDRRAMIAKLRDGTGRMLMLQLVVAIDDKLAAEVRIAALQNLTESAPTMLPVIAPRVAHALRKDVTTLAGATRGDVHEAALRLQRAIAP